MKLLSIDTSIAKIGWAVLDDKHPVGEKMLKGYGTIKIPAMAISEKTRNITIAIKEIIEKYTPDEAVIETPKPFTYGRSKRFNRPLNQKAMAKNNIAVGVITSTCSTLGLKTHHLSAQDWKGNQNKDATLWIVNQTYGLELKKSHNDEADAIKMGQYLVEEKRIEKMIVRVHDKHKKFG